MKKLFLLFSLAVLIMSSPIFAQCPDVLLSGKGLKPHPDGGFICINPELDLKIEVDFSNCGGTCHLQDIVMNVSSGCGEDWYPWQEPEQGTDTVIFKGVDICCGANTVSILITGYCNGMMYEEAYVIVIYGTYPPCALP